MDNSCAQHAAPGSMDLDQNLICRQAQAQQLFIPLDASQNFKRSIKSAKLKPQPKRC